MPRWADRLASRVAPLIRRPPEPSALKAQLTSDGGICPKDGTPLEFDPGRPRSHRCPRCKQEYTGERHDRAAARWQHLWTAERAAELAAVAAVGNRQDAADASRRSFGVRLPLYGLSNSDNVLGPSRLFFSTYLESIWLNNYLAAATMLREAGMLDSAVEEGVNSVADDAAT